ncbi:extracellular solute-binding protein [Salana multivorans]
MVQSISARKRMVRGAAAVAAAGLMLGLAACGGDSGNSGGGGSDGGDGEITGSITFQTWSLTPTFQDYLDGVIAAFEEANPGTEVTLQDQPGDGYSEKVLTQAASNTLPDVINLPPDFALPLAKAGMLDNLDESDPNLTETYVAGGLEAYQFPGLEGTWSYPWYLNTDINYTPSQGWFHSWLDLDHAAVARDFAQIASLGLDHVRIFPLWPIVQPNRSLLRPRALREIREVVDLAGEAGLDVGVDAIQGHLSSFDFLPSWLATWHDRNMFTNPDVVGSLADYVREVAAAVADASNLLGVTVGNEVNQFAARPHPDPHEATPAQVTQWLDAMIGAARDGLGDVVPPAGVTHAMYDASWYDDRQPFLPEHAAELGDFTVTHSWVFNGSAQRHGGLGTGSVRHAEYLLRLSAAWHRDADRRACSTTWTSPTRTSPRRMSRVVSRRTSSRVSRAPGPTPGTSTRTSTTPRPRGGSTPGSTWTTRRLRVTSPRSRVSVSTMCGSSRSGRSCSRTGRSCDRGRCARSARSSTSRVRPGWTWELTPSRATCRASTSCRAGSQRGTTATCSPTRTWSARSPTTSGRWRPRWPTPRTCSGSPSATRSTSSPRGPTRTRTRRRRLRSPSGSTR